MTKEAVKQVVERMIIDEEFRSALLQDADAAINEAGYDVTEEEIAAFKSLEESDLADLSPDELQERLSKTILTPIFFIDNKAT